MGFACACPTVLACSVAKTDAEAVAANAAVGKHVLKAYAASQLVRPKSAETTDAKARAVIVRKMPSVFPDSACRSGHPWPFRPFTVAHCETEMCGAGETTTRASWGTAQLFPEVLQ